ncbi:murein hydrolase activator EnvC family protein [Micromonospora sp. DT81.3]|uniref:murein hydrolase activator EnvC family protein n=1 Tax=Actinomycetes TaxID=1760 RepID=UPI003CFBB8A3
MPRIVRSLAGLAVAAVLLGMGPPAPGTTAAAAAVSGAEPVWSTGAGFRVASGTAWVWPVEGSFRVVERFVAPAHDYAPGHRGIDLEPRETLHVRAPAAGTIAFSGQVAGRRLLTIDHGDGLVTTLEPVDGRLEAGAAVSPAEVVGSLSLGGHAAAGTVHFGVRLDGRYINPMLLLGGVPRAVLVPCCEPLH